jgi:peptidoglycan/xylan/chitin deacetylase (PgdA/CDA1 family)
LNEGTNVCLLLTVAVVGKLAALLLLRTAPAAALALWFGPDALLAWHLFVPGAQGLGRTHCRFTTNRREVWLTIDDGPDPEDTPRILALLAAHGARATFFVIGEKAVRHPGLIRAITAAGHEVGHHTHTHPQATFWCASPARVRRELDDGLAALRAAGAEPTRFRPPVGIKNLWLAPLLRARALTCIAWSARALERQGGGVEAVANRTTRGVAPGSILLMHEGPRLPPSIRVAAIGQVLARLKIRGYRCIVPTAEQVTG